MTRSSRRLIAASAAVLATALAFVPGASASAATAPTAPRVAVGRVPLASAGTTDLARFAGQARPAVHSDGLVPLPHEHYTATDPDNNSVFSPGGADKGSGTLSSASGDHPTSANPSPGTVGFVGITGIEQAEVNDNGDLEPPDQGLCTDGSTVVEYVNNALEVYTSSGEHLAGPIASPDLFGLPASTFMADPRCYYDAPTHRWFLLEFDIGSTNVNGGEASPSTQYIAVSDTANPLGRYHVLSLDTTDSTVSGCPCYGDFDQMGADLSGFYISTNEFGISSGAFNGAIIYAFDKRALERAGGLGASQPSAVTYRLISDQFTQPYHVAPAQTAPGSDYPTDREYFVESNSDANRDHHLILYTLQGTHLLTRGGVPLLTSTYFRSEAYAFPPNGQQPGGPIPLGRSVHEPHGTLQADFNAVQEVTYAGGRLYAEADTAVSGHRDGIAWWILQPSTTSTDVAVVHQGYLTAPNADLLYPDIGVDAQGHGYLVFTITGRSTYPSAADTRFGSNGPIGAIHVAAAGTSSEDGFTCYAAFVGPDYGGCRWGDYSMAVAGGSRIFMATEYIAPVVRDYYTNWATYVWSAPTSD